MRDVTETTFTLARETLKYRLSTRSIDPADARIDASELFGMWRLAYRLAPADKRLEAINGLHFRLGDASAQLRVLDPDASLRELYRSELAHLDA